MGHKIAEAVIENGQLKYVDRQLPPGRLRVHLIYDAIELPAKNEAAKIVREASGIYKDIDVEAESKSLRNSWERDIHG